MHHLFLQWRIYIEYNSSRKLFPRNTCDAHLVELSNRTLYLNLTRFPDWCKKVRGEKTDIKPASMDVSDYDILVFGSPVRAFKPTPAFYTSIDSLEGCERKKAAAFSTLGGTPGQTDEIFRRWIDSREMKLIAVTGIHQKDIVNKKKTRETLSLITQKNRYPPDILLFFDIIQYMA